MKSKTLLLFILILTLSGALKAQATLEHRYMDEIQPFNTSQSGTWYRENSMYNDSVLSVYKPDFSLYKDIELPVGNFAPENYINVIFLSDKLFNSDNKLEYLLYYHVSTGYNLIRNVIANEDGDILVDFGELSSGYPQVYSRPGMSPILMISYVDLELETYVTDIYSLPGTYVSVPEQSTGIAQYPAPNPATSTIEIPYNITNPKDAILTICNSAGVVTGRHILDRNQNKVTLDVSGMAKGVYIYKYGNTSRKFIVR